MTGPIRVLLWTESFWPTIGGSEVMATSLLDQLRPRGFQFQVVTRRSSSTEPARLDYRGTAVHRLLIDEDVTHDVSCFVPGEQKHLQNLLVLRQEVARLKRDFRPHLVHVHLLGPSVFLHRFTSESAWPVPTLISQQVSLVDGELAPNAHAGRALAEANWVVAPSRFLLTEIRDQVPSVGSRSSVIPNALPAPGVAPAPLPWPPRLLCVGRLVRDKGFDLAIEGFGRVLQRFPDARLLLAGDGPERANLEALAAQSGLADRVEFCGWVDPQHVPALVNQSTVVLVPSRREAFGLVALQAGQMARPVVATSSGGTPEVVGHNQTGILIGEDPSAMELAGSVCDLLSDREKIAALGRAARGRIAECFDVESRSDAYARLYRQLASQPSVSRSGCTSGMEVADE